MSIKERLLRYFDLRKRAPVKCHSVYALMPNGSMKEGSLGLMLYTELIAAYENPYEDNVDNESVMAAITANYQHETEVAWHAFLAQVDDE